MLPDTGTLPGKPVRGRMAGRKKQKNAGHPGEVAREPVNPGKGGVATWQPDQAAREL